MANTQKLRAKTRKRGIMTKHIEFAILGIVLMFAVVGFLDNSSLTGSAVKVVDKTTNTIMFSKIELNKPIAQKIPSIGSEQLISFSPATITTANSATRYSQALKFDSPTEGLNGGNITFDKDEEGMTSDFLTFNDLVFDYKIIFSPGLESNLNSNNSLTDLEDRRIFLIGKPYVFSKAKVSNNEIELILFGDQGRLNLKDSDFTDNSFHSGVSINGEFIRGAKVKIAASRINNRIVISEIIYRLLPVGRSDESILRVAPRTSVGDSLKFPEALLSSNFDIYYGGLGSAGVTTTTTQSSGNLIEFDPSGKGYSLKFINARGHAYSITSFLSSINGVVEYGDQRHNLIFQESAGYFIDRDDFFIAMDQNDVDGETNIVQYHGINKNSNALVLRDSSGGFAAGSYNPTSGNGTMILNGHSYPVQVDLVTEGNPMRADLNGDEKIDSGTSKIITLGGGMLELSGGGLRTLNLNLRSKKKLFQDRTSDELLTITISEDSGRLTANVLNQADLSMQTDQSLLDKGLSSYGAYFELDKRRKPSTLKINYPAKKGVVVRSLLSGGDSKSQSTGFVIVTAEKERFLEFLKQQNQQLIK